MLVEMWVDGGERGGGQGGRTGQEGDEGGTVDYYSGHGEGGLGFGGLLWWKSQFNR